MALCPDRCFVDAALRHAQVDLPLRVTVARRCTAFLAGELNEAGRFRMSCLRGPEAVSKKTATPASRGVKLRRWVCLGCDARLETIEVTQRVCSS